MVGFQTANCCSVCIFKDVNKFKVEPKVKLSLFTTSDYVVVETADTKVSTLRLGVET